MEKEFKDFEEVYNGDRGESSNGRIGTVIESWPAAYIAYEYDDDDSLLNMLYDGEVLDGDYAVAVDFGGEVIAYAYGPKGFRCYVDRSDE